MKTDFKRMAIVLLFMIVGSLTSGAQTFVCPYTIHNDLSCSVTLDITLLEQNPGCMPCSGGVITVTVSANSTLNLTCANVAANCGNPICGIQIQMTSPVTSAVGTMGGPPVPLSTGCGAASEQMVVNVADCNIDP